MNRDIDINRRRAAQLAPIVCCLAAPRLSPGELRRSVCDGFSQNKVVTLCGWHLSITEGRVLALLAKDSRNDAL